MRVRGNINTYDPCVNLLFIDCYKNITMRKSRGYPPYICQFVSKFKY